MKYELPIRVGSEQGNGETPMSGAATGYPTDVMDAIRIAVTMYNNDMKGMGLPPTHVRTYHVNGRRIVVQGREMNGRRGSW